mmetsp:Transcript_142304/g.354614  ORF Transcript_142304/g.354614 Transcript_142304/m.354614 type:complete len:215 (+) Transcript_142304:291-935(+)
MWQDETCGASGVLARLLRLGHAPETSSAALACGRRARTTGGTREEFARQLASASERSLRCGPECLRDLCVLAQPDDHGEGAESSLHSSDMGWARRRLCVHVHCGSRVLAPPAEQLGGGRSWSLLVHRMGPLWAHRAGVLIQPRAGRFGPKQGGSRHWHELPQGRRLSGGGPVRREDLQGPVAGRRCRICGVRQPSPLRDRAGGAGGHWRRRSAS